MKLNLFSFLFVFLVLSTSVFAEVSVSLNDDASATNDLVCSFSGEGYEREWILNGIVQDQFKNQERIDASNLMKNDVWTCNVYSFRIGRYTFDRVLQGSDTAVVINSAPVITSTSPTSVCVGSAYTYDVEAFDADEDVLAYSLVSGPSGMTIDADNGFITWIPSATGMYSLQISVTDGEATVYQLITIIVSTCTADEMTVDAIASPDSGERPLEVDFSAVVQNGNGLLHYVWNFGDGSAQSLDSNPTHTYSAVGDYTVMVIVYDSTVPTAKQANDTVVVHVMEQGTPLAVTASANPTSGDEPLNVSFTASASGGFGGYSYFWTFGDGASSTLQNINHVYDEEGAYTARVTVTSGTLSAARTFTINVDEEDDDDSDSEEYDLFVENIKFDPENPNQGSELTALVTLENAGDEDMDNLQLKMEIEDLNVETSSSKFDLNDGDKETVEVALDLPSKVAEGYYTVKFTIKNNDFTVTKYRELFIKGTKANVQPVTSTNVVTQNNIQGYSAPAGKARVNWLGIWFMILLFLALLALVIYLTKKAMTKEEKVEVTSLDEMI
ncbi:PKD domain-containing protein [Candidatus Woesearchaeota archaeon]|nr:PKD domain-containing protein [Candidatus Woesearchaeota archaeon]